MHERWRWMTALALAASLAGPLAAQERKTFDVYVLDVEGGGATLFVSPTGESVLIDSGYQSNGRDAERIIAAAKDAGLTQIDHLITSHYHGDHMGGFAELVARFPVKHFVDHGENSTPQSSGTPFVPGYMEYMRTARRTSVKPGEKLAIKGIDWLFVASDGQVLPAALPGAGQPNPACATFPRQEETNFEDYHAVASVVTYGRFRFAHLADLTVNYEFQLMCPNNRIGTVDAWVVSNHGQPRSGSAVLAHALRPRVAIMNNAARKGGVPDTMRIVYTIPGLEDLWQLHFSELGGQEYATPGLFIANGVDHAPSTVNVAPFVPPPAGAAAPGGAAAVPPAPVHNGPAFWIKLSAQADGTFTVTNARNGFTKTYRPADRAGR